MKAGMRDVATDRQPDLAFRHWASALVMVSLGAWALIFGAARLIVHLF